MTLELSAFRTFSYLLIETIIQKKTHIVGKREEVAGVTLRLAVIQTMPRLSWRKIPTPGEPVSTRETYDRHECVANLVDNQDRGIGRRGSDRSLVEHHHAGELCKKELLVASLLLALLTRPVCDGDGFDCLSDCIRDCLFLLCGCKRELDHCIRLRLCRMAIVALDGICHPETHQLVKEGNLVDEKLDQLVRIPDSLSCRHVRGHLDRLVEGFESLVTLGPPDLGKTCLDHVLVVLVALVEPRLKIGNAKHGLEGGVDPAGTILVAKSEHVYLKKAEKSVKNGTGSVLKP